MPLPQDLDQLAVLGADLEAPAPLAPLKGERVLLPYGSTQCTTMRSPKSNSTGTPC